MSGERVEQTRRTVTVVVSYAVTGADLMQADYSQRRFVPEVVTLTDRDGDVSAAAGGSVPKKDGTPSLHLAHHTVASWMGHHLANEPEWLQNLVRDYCADAGIEDPR